MPIRFLTCATIALFAFASSGCGEAQQKESAPAASNSAAIPQSSEGGPSTNLDDYPVEAIKIEEFFTDRANIPKFSGKRVTWQCVIETVDDFHESSASFSATGFPVEFEGLTEPVQGEGEDISAFSNRYTEYAQKEIKRVGQTVTFFFKERADHDKLKDAKGKRATISGLVAESPIAGSADLNHSRVVSIDN